MAIIQTPQVKAWYPVLASDAGNLFVVRGVQSGTQAIAQNDVLEMVKLPKGAIIHEIIVDFPACGTSVTADVGCGDTEDRFIAAKDVAAAVIARLESNRGYAMPAEDTIDIKLEGADPTDDLTIAMEVLYSLP